MSDTPKKEAAPEQQSSTTYELDLNTIGKLVFKTSPWLFAIIIAFFASSVGFAFSRFYELKELITKTDNQIQVLRTEINGNIKLLEQKLETGKKPGG
jgi:hypothetical protein